MCNHKIDIKMENGNIVSFCTICGEILNVKPAQITEISSINQNGGVILHD